MNDLEWSFGCCEKGTGVYSCKPRDNPMYTYRETITLGATTFSDYQVWCSVHLNACTAYCHCLERRFLEGPPRSLAQV